MADKNFKVNEGIDIESGKSLKVGGVTVIDTDGLIDWSKVKNRAATYTPSSHNHDTSYYTKAQVDTNISTAITDLQANAPTALDTLNELADALGDDAAFHTTMVNALAGKSASTHLHDDRYYKETELQTSGQASVHWNNLSNKPAIVTSTTETVEDIAGGMIGATNGIAVSYDDVTGNINYTVSTQSDNNLTTALKNNYDAAYTHSQSAHNYLPLTGGNINGNSSTYTPAVSIIGNTQSRAVLALQAQRTDLNNSNYGILTINAVKNKGSDFELLSAYSSDFADKVFTIRGDGYTEIGHNLTVKHSGTTTSTIEATSNAGALLLIRANNATRLKMHADSSGTWIGTVSNQNLNFVTNGDYSTKMTIKTDGNVGIGDTNPSGKLTVDGLTSSSHVIFRGNGNGDSVNLDLNMFANDGSNMNVGLYASPGSTTYDGYITVGDGNYGQKITQRGDTHNRIYGANEDITYNRVSLAWNQTGGDHWIKVLTPQYYGSSAGGGYAEFNLSYFSGHATGSVNFHWRMIFGNNHGRAFSYASTPIEKLESGTSYGSYNYSPASKIEIWAENGSDTTMREMWIKVIGVSGFNGSYNNKRVLTIRGETGRWSSRYQISNMGSTGPGGGATLRFES